MDARVTEYIEQYSDFRKSILRDLRLILLEFQPELKESIKWKIPFYAYLGNVCYLNARKRDVQLGFVQGLRMQDDGLLEGNGAQVRHITFSEGDVIDKEAIFEKLQEAVIINELRY